MFMAGVVILWQLLGTLLRIDLFLLAMTAPLQTHFTPFFFKCLPNDSTSRFQTDVYGFSSI